MAARALLQVNFWSISGEIFEEDVDPGLESGVRGGHESLEASEYDSGSAGISAAPRFMPTLRFGFTRDH